MLAGQLVFLMSAGCGEGLDEVVADFDLLLDGLDAVSDEVIHDGGLGITQVVSEKGKARVFKQFFSCFGLLADTLPPLGDNARFLREFGSHKGDYSISTT